MRYIPQLATPVTCFFFCFFFQYDDAVLRSKQRTVLRPRLDWLVEPLLGKPTRIRDQPDTTVPGGGLANLEVSFWARVGSS